MPRPLTDSLPDDAVNLVRDCRTAELALGARAARVLVVGERAGGPVVKYLQSRCATPIREWTSEAPPRQGTVLVPALNALTGDDLGRLLTWLDEYGAQVSVVAASDEPLFPLVKRHQFSAQLYYRLNTVLITVPKRSTPS